MDEMKNVKLYENEDAWKGIYELNYGWLECWETCQSLDYDDSVGGIYYNIYDNLTDFKNDDVWDGGLMEYREDSTFDGFIEFVLMAHGVDIIRKVN